MQRENNSINRPVFDMLRSLAVVMVFTIHFLAFRNVPVPRFVFDFFTHCSYGVSIFFAISGYLIMQSLENSRSVKEYFLKRVSRIIPAYYAILIFGIIVWDILLGRMPGDSLLGLGWLRYFLFLNGIVPSNEYYYWNDLWGLWTMSCFMLFYLLAPLVKKWIKSYKASLLMLLAVVAAAYGYKAVLSMLLAGAGIPDGEVFAGDSAVFNMISFAFGTAAWYAVREGKDKQYLALVIAAVSGFLAIRTDSYNRIIWSLLTVAFMLSMKDFAYGRRTGWIGKALAAFSKYSFTVYLVHMPVLELLQYFSENVFYLGFAPFLALSLGLTAAMAVFLGKAVEQPFAGLIRRLGQSGKEENRKK